jgi:hypothetical protein
VSGWLQAHVIQPDHSQNQCRGTAVAMVRLRYVTLHYITLHYMSAKDCTVPGFLNFCEGPLPDSNVDRSITVINTRDCVLNVRWNQYRHTGDVEHRQLDFLM